MSESYSPSRLDCYKDCPRRYRFRYVDKIKRPSQSVEAFLGTCVHAALEKLYEDLAHGRRLSLEEALAAYEDAWQAEWTDAITVRRYAPEDWRKLGRECVTLYYEANKPFDRDRTVAVERKVGFPLGDFKVEGYVDRLALAKDGAFEIHDYKTSGSLPTQADVDQDWQLALYDLAVRSLWPDAKEVRLVWHYVRHGKTLVSKRTAEQREALKAEVNALVETIRHDHVHEPKKSALCDWCEYRDLCPLFAHGEKVASMTIEQLKADDGVRLVAELSGIDKQKKELREKLRELERDQKAVEQALVRFAAERKLSAVAGLDGEAVITEKDEWKLPTKTHSPEAYIELETELRASPLWKDVSHLDAHRLLDGYKRKEWPQAVLGFIEGLLGRFGTRAKEPAVRFHRKKETDAD